MATNNNRKVTSKNTTKTTTKIKSSSTNTKVSAEPVTTTEPKKTIQNVDLSQYIPVYNGFHGKLIYISPKTHEEFVWEQYGDVQEIELKELVNAKSSSKGFFINNWFMFDDDFKWVIEILGMSNYYNNAIDIYNYDDIFDLAPDELRAKIESMTKYQKESLTYRAKELIENGDLDSNKRIKTLESVLGVELIER